jgi:hypothetical protein
MSNSSVRVIALLACIIGLELRAEAAKAPVISMTCFVVMEEGSSSEGNSLFLKKMGVEPSLIKLFAPTSFITLEKGIKTQAKGDFAYEAGSPELVTRSKRLALYEVPVRYRASSPPKAAKSVVVEFKLEDLARSGGLVQPAEKAIALAAAKAAMKSGTAWVVEMSYAKGSFKAKVELGP